MYHGKICIIVLSSTVLGPLFHFKGRVASVQEVNDMIKNKIWPLGESFSHLWLHRSDVYRIHFLHFPHLAINLFSILPGERLSLGYHLKVWWRENYGQVNPRCECSVAFYAVRDARSKNFVQPSVFRYLADNRGNFLPLKRPSQKK